MTRVTTFEEVERLARAIGFPVALHAGGPVQSIDRRYVHSEEMLRHQIEFALAAAEKNKADGVIVLPFPNSRHMPDRSR